MKKVISKQLSIAIESGVDSYNKNELLEFHACEEIRWSGERQPLNSLNVIELAELLINGYEVEKTIEEKLIEQRDVYIKESELNYIGNYKLEGFNSALRILECEINDR